MLIQPRHSAQTSWDDGPASPAQQHHASQRSQHQSPRTQPMRGPTPNPGLAVVATARSTQSDARCWPVNGG